jgi:hypothetical protein
MLIRLADYALIAAVAVFCCSADTFLQLVFPYVLPGSARLSSHILSSGDSAQIRWSAASEAPECTDVVEQECMQLLSVLAEALFRQRAATLAAFGKLFWRPFVDQYQAAFLQQVSGSNVAVLQARQEAALQMEKQAVSMGLAEPGEQCPVVMLGVSSHVALNLFDKLPNAVPQPSSVCLVGKLKGGKRQSPQLSSAGQGVHAYYKPAPTQ